MKATTARARASVAGRAFLRSAIESGEVSLSGLDFSEKTGTLTSTPKATTAGPVGRGAYRVDVKVGRMERKNVSRLQVLPQRSRAKILFLGVREGGRSVSFLNLQHKRVKGATCKPSPTDCERITLRRGRVATVGGVRVRSRGSGCATSRARHAPRRPGSARTRPGARSWATATSI